MTTQKNARTDADKDREERDHRLRVENDQQRWEFKAKAASVLVGIALLAATILGTTALVNHHVSEQVEDMSKAGYSGDEIEEALDLP